MAKEEPKRSQWRRMTNSHGQKLYIQDPQLFTEDELKWIKNKHDANNPSEPFEIVHKETQAPKDPRTAVIDGIYHIVWVRTQNNPDLQPPDFYKQDMWRLTKKWRKGKEVWQPKPEVEEKRP